MIDPLKHSLPITKYLNIERKLFYAVFLRVNNQCLTSFAFRNLIMNTVGGMTSAFSASSFENAVLTLVSCTNSIGSFRINVVEVKMLIFGITNWAP